MKTEVYNFLLIGGSPSNVDGIIKLLRDTAKIEFDYRYVATPWEIEAALHEQQWDLILFNSALPDAILSNNIQLASQLQAQTPLIVLLETTTVQEVVDLMRLGARGVVEKGNHPRLIDLIRQELEASRTAQRSKASALNDQQQYLKNILGNMHEAVYSLSLPDRQLIYASTSFESVFGYPLQKILDDADFFKQIVHPDDLERAIAAQQTGLRDGFAELEHRIVLPDGQVRWLHRYAWVIFDKQGHPIQIVDHGHDITQRKLAEEALLESENLLRLFIEYAPAAIAMLDREMRYLAVSRRWLTDYRLPDENIIGRSHYEILPEIPERNKQVNQRCLNGVVEKCEADPFPRADGSLDWVRWEVHPWFAANGEVGGLLLFSEVITDRVQAEEALRQSEKRYRQMFELHALPKLIIDPETGEIADANPAAGQFYGYDVTTLKTLTIFDLNLSPLSEVKAKMAQASASTMLSCEFVHRGAHNQPRDVEVFTGPLEIDGREFLYSLVIDVTEKKQAQRALQEAHALLELRVIERTSELGKTTDRLEAIFNHSGDGIVLLDVEHGLQQTNYAFDEAFGVEEDCCIGISLSTFFDPDPAGSIEACVRDVAKTHQTQRIEARARRSDGTSFEVEMSLSPVNRSHNVVTNLVCIIRDITVRKEQERQLRYHASVQENMSDAVIVTDMDLHIQSWNKAAERIYGWSESEVLGRVSSDIVRSEFSSPEERQRVIEAIQAGSWWQAEVVQRRKDDSQVNILGSVTVVHDENGRPLGIVAVNRDITNRKQTEEALAESEARYRLLAENIEDVIMTFSMDRRISYFSPSCQKLLGYLPKEVVGRLHSEFIHPDDYPQVIDRTRQAVAAHEGAYTNSFRLRHKAGHYIWYEVNTRIIREPATGDVVDFVSVLRDITERKQAETALRESEERYRLLAENVTDLVIRQDLSGNYRYVSPSSLMVVGYTPEEMAGRNGLDDIHPDDRSEVLTTVGSILEQHPPATQLTFRFRHKNGHYIWLESSGRMVFSPVTGEPIGLITAARDVTTRKEAEEALQKSAAEIHDLYNNAPTGYHSLDKEGTVVQMNDTELRWLGYSRNEVVGKLKFTDLVASSSVDTFRQSFPIFKERGWINDLEFEMRRKDGSTFTVSLSATAVYDETGQYVQSRSTLFDITEVKKARQAVAEERNLLRTVIDSVPDFIYVKDRQHRMLLNNKAHLRSLNATLMQDMIGHTDYDLFPQALADKFIHDEDLLFQTEQAIVNDEERSVGQHGEEIWALTTKVPLRNLRGELIGLVGITRDVTEIKTHQEALRRSEAQLRESQNMLRLVLDTIPVRVFWKDVQSDFLGCNRLFAQDAGLEDPSNIVGKNDSDMPWYTEEATTFRTDDLSIMSSGIPRIGYEETLKTANGDHLIIQTTKLPLQNTENAIIGVLGAYVDITKRKQAEAERIALSQRLQLATEAGGIGVWDWDIQTDALIWDGQMVSLYGLTRDQFTDRMPKPWNSGLVHPDDFTQIQKEIGVALAGENSLDIEFRITRPDGELRHLKVKAVVFRDTAGKPMRVIGVAWDITLLKQAEEDLRLALEKEKEVGELKSRFVSIASHEFRTPLAAILASTETLTRYRARMDDAQIDIRLDKIRQQVDHMKGIMEDVLQLARIQAGRLEFQPIDSDLNALCQDIVEEFRSQPEHRERVSYRCVDAPIIAFIDLRLMRQVIANLVSNALKYSPLDKSIHIELTHDAHSARCRVSDEGIGIPPEDLKRLFEPFHRARNVGAISGTGLGLSITKEAVSAHGGSIEVKSEVNKGTTFTVVLPLIRGESENANDKDSDY